MAAMHTIMLRAKLTEREWARIRKIAIDQGVPTSQLIGNTLRAALLRGAKS